MSNGRAEISAPAITTPYGVVMAGALISALPLLIVFFFVQKRFVEGIAMTGMK